MHYDRSGACSDVRMGGSSEDDDEAGASTKADSFRKFAFAHRSDSNKAAPRKAGSTKKPSLRAQLSDALSKGKKSVRILSVDKHQQVIQA